MEEVGLILFPVQVHLLSVFLIIKALIIFDRSNLNSEITPINFLPKIVLRTLRFTVVESGGDIPDVLATSGAGSTPFTIGDTVGVTAGIALGAGTIFYLVQVRGFKPNLNRFKGK